MSSTSLTPDQQFSLSIRDAMDCSLIMLPNPRGWNDKNKTPEQIAEIKDRAQTLQTGIGLSYENKLLHARKVIRAALESPARWQLSYSGGKDSTVLSHLMFFDLKEKVPHVNSNTRMEYPETVAQIQKWYSMMRYYEIDCHVVFPDKRPKELWREIGVPLWSKMIAYKYRKFFNSPDDRISKDVPANLVPVFHKLKAAGFKVTDQCCDELKKKPMKKFAKKQGFTGSFTGVRCAESRMRRLNWIRFGSLYNSSYHGDQWICNPLSFWTESDVFRYLDENGIRPESTSSARGGSGCVTCMFGCHISKTNSMQELAVNNPKMHQVALDDWGYREVLDFLEIPYT
jgi:3'-phosphoadenosine 5'-phosphosulfate sulfotransferase (PAPS reductase)/FAD synthetase